MLLGNLTVAKKIHGAFPELAVLRRHLPPDEKGIASTKEFLEQVGMGIDASSAAALHRSLESLRATLDADTLKMVIFLCTKPMQQARPAERPAPLCLCLCLR